MTEEIEKLLQKSEHALEVEILEPTANIEIEEGKEFLKIIKQLLMNK